MGDLQVSPVTCSCTLRPSTIVARLTAALSHDVMTVTIGAIVVTGARGHVLKPLTFLALKIARQCNSDSVGHRQHLLAFVPDWT